VTRIDGDFIWQLKKFLMNASDQAFEIAAREIGATNAVVKKNIACNY
jgi:hypothetical protein